MIAVRNDIRIYTIDGVDNDYTKGPKMQVRSAGSNTKQVEVYVDGKFYAVMGYDLIEAVKNSMNVNQ